MNATADTIDDLRARMSLLTGSLEFIARQLELTADEEPSADVALWECRIQARSIRESIQEYLTRK
jgi:hypothetical protein